MVCGVTGFYDDNCIGRIGISKFTFLMNFFLFIFLILGFLCLETEF